MKLYNDDCLKILKQLPDKSVDLVVTDPPYDVDVNHDGGKLYADKKLAKSNEELVNLNIDNGYDIETIGNELVRVMKRVNVYFWCNKKQVPAYFNFYVNKLGCKFEIISWHKTNALPTFNGKYLTDTEYCLYFFEGGHKLCHPSNYEDAKTYYNAPINSKDKKIWKHPTIKPVDIIERLIRNSSNEGDLVLDCFMGSGTTGVACKNLKRDFVGIEISKEYFEIATERINSSISSKNEKPSVAGFKFGV